MKLLRTMFLTGAVAIPVIVGIFLAGVSALVLPKPYSQIVAALGFVPLLFAAYVVMCKGRVHFPPPNQP